MLPKLGKRRVKDVNRADVARLMTEMAETPAMANKVLTLLSKAFNLAEVSAGRHRQTEPPKGIPLSAKRDQSLAKSTLDAVASSSSNLTNQKAYETSPRRGSKRIACDSMAP